MFAKFHVRQPGSLPQLAADGQRNNFSHEPDVPDNGDCRQVAASHILYGGDGADGVERLAGKDAAFDASVEQAKWRNAAGFMGLFEAKSTATAVKRIEGLRGEDQ
jgi:hypothetical protein